MSLEGFRSGLHMALKALRLGRHGAYDSQSGGFYAHGPERKQEAKNEQKGAYVTAKLGCLLCRLGHRVSLSAV